MKEQKNQSVAPAQPNLRLDPKRRGYIVDGDLREGFADNPSLPAPLRTMIARWAERFSPDQLSDAQRELLEAAPSPSISVRQSELAENQRELHSPYLAILFDSLDEDDQRAIQDPAAAGVTSTGYPLTVGQLAALSGASDRQIRSWADERLLPFYREGSDRRFYGAAAIRAFALAQAPGYSKAIAAAAARGEVGEHFQLLAATLARAAARMPLDLRERLIALAEDLSSSSRLMADVSDASELNELWRVTAEGPVTPSRRPASDTSHAMGARRSNEKTRKSRRPQGKIAVERRQSDMRTIPSPDTPKTVVIEYKLVDGPGRRPPMEVSEADEILYAKYGGTRVTTKDVMVLTVPRGAGKWINRISDRKQAFSVHTTKAEAEERGRQIAKERHGKHVIYQRDGSISRSHNYN